MKTSAAKLIIAVALVCFIQCNHGDEKNEASGIRIVHVPHKLLPGCTMAPEMNAIFRTLHAGDEAKIELVFLDAENALETSETLNIKEGSVYFYSNVGYFRLDSKGKVYSNPDGQHEVELDASFHGIAIDYNAISNTSASSTIELKYKIQPIKSEQMGGQYIGHIIVKLSPDFQGDVLGWQSCHGT